MTITMDAELMSAVVDLLNQLWILLNMLSDQKECRADVMFCQYLQHLRRILGMWTIVKGQRDLAARPISLP